MFRGIATTKGSQWISAILMVTRGFHRFWPISSCFLLDSSHPGTLVSCWISYDLRFSMKCHVQSIKKPKWKDPFSHDKNHGTVLMNHGTHGKPMESGVPRLRLGRARQPVRPANCRRRNRCLQQLRWPWGEHVPWRRESTWGPERWAMANDGFLDI